MDYVPLEQLEAESSRDPANPSIADKILIHAGMMGNAIHRIALDGAGAFVPVMFEEQRRAYCYGEDSTVMLYAQMEALIAAGNFAFVKDTDLPALFKQYVDSRNAVIANGKLRRRLRVAMCPKCGAEVFFHAPNDPSCCTRCALVAAAASVDHHDDPGLDEDVKKHIDVVAWDELGK